MKPLSIGQVARRAGVGVETVRFYEREGLLEEPARRESGYREYEGSVVARLQFIRRAKELGFTLNEIKELLSLRLDQSTSCADVRGKAEVKIADIEAKIRILQRMKKALVKLTKACSGRGWNFHETPQISLQTIAPTVHRRFSWMAKMWRGCNPEQAVPLAIFMKGMAQDVWDRRRSRCSFVHSGRRVSGPT